MDQLDRQIIEMLATDARVPLTQVARELGVASATVHQRFNRLRERGILLDARISLNWADVGLPVVATVSLAVGRGSLEDVAERLHAIPYIESCFSVTGEFDLLIVIRAASGTHLGEILDDVRKITPGASRTVVVLNTYFDGRIPPLPVAK
jgi:DNA-binding Lrp family transcriptional regulator